MSDVLGTIGVVLLLLLAALAAMAETWIVRLGRVRAHRMAQERRSRGSDLVVRIVEDPAPYLTAVLFLGVLAYLLAAALGTALLADTLEVGGTVGAAALMAVGIFVLCCLVPKTVTLQRMEGVARVLAGPVCVVGKLLRPLTKLFVLVSNALMMLLPGGGLPKGPFSTEEELRLLPDADKEEDGIEEVERELSH